VRFRAAPFFALVSATRNTRLNGVSATAVNPWSMRVASLYLYHNKFAKLPWREIHRQVSQATLTSNGRMAYSRVMCFNCRPTGREKWNDDRCREPMALFHPERLAFTTAPAHRHFQALEMKDKPRNASALLS